MILDLPLWLPFRTFPVFACPVRTVSALLVHLCYFTVTYDHPAFNEDTASHRRLSSIDVPNEDDVKMLLGYVRADHAIRQDFYSNAHVSLTIRDCLIIGTIQIL
jgi:hypothetical protein